MQRKILPWQNSVTVSSVWDPPGFSSPCIGSNCDHCNDYSFCYSYAFSLCVHAAGHHLSKGGQGIFLKSADEEVLRLRTVLCMRKVLWMRTVLWMRLSTKPPLPPPPPFVCIHRQNDHISTLNILKSMSVLTEL